MGSGFSDWEQAWSIRFPVFVRRALSWFLSFDTVFRIFWPWPFVIFAEFGL